MSSIVSKLQSISLNILQASRIAVDLGTSLTRLALYKKGIVLREPTFTGYNTRAKEYLFYGKEAKDIYGKSPVFVSVVRPIQQGIIADFDACVYLVSQFMRRAVEPYFQHPLLLRPRMEGFTAVPTSATEVERKAIEESLLKSGFSSCHVFEKSVCAALGAHQPVFSKKPVFVVDIGAGLVEMAIIIMGGIVSAKTLHLGGDHMDRLLKNYLHLKYGLIIGDQTAEQLKIHLLTLEDAKDVMTIRGKSLENGLPKSVRVTTSDVREALVVTINQIIDGIKELIEAAPPETVDGILKAGLTLTGAIAKVPGLDRYIMKEIKLPVIVANNPEDATIRGLEMLMDDPTQSKKIMI